MEGESVVIYFRGWPTLDERNRAKRSTSSHKSTRRRTERWYNLHPCATCSWIPSKPDKCATFAPLTKAWTISVISTWDIGLGVWNIRACMALDKNPSWCPPSRTALGANGALKRRPPPIELLDCRPGWLSCIITRVLFELPDIVPWDE